MRRLGVLLTQIRGLFGGRADPELDAEMREHLHLLTQRYVARGMSPEEGAQAARRQFGNMTALREQRQLLQTIPTLESFARDVLLALRNSLRAPGSTSLTLLMLGATMGLNTSIVTLFNGYATRGWSARNPSELVQLFRVDMNATTGRVVVGGFPLEEFRYVAEHSRTLSGVIAMHDGREITFGDEIPLGDGDGPMHAWYVSGSYFHVLGIPMAKGRSFAAEDDRVDAPQPVVVLGHYLWVNDFKADPEIVGKDIRLNGVPFRVVGVAPSTFGGTHSVRTDSWVPFASMPLLRPLDPHVHAVLTDPNNCCITAVAGRLAPGISADQASAELNVLDRQFTTTYKQPDRHIIVTDTAFLSNPGIKRGIIISMFQLFFLGVSVVFLLTCANIGSLLIVRGTARRREIAIRTALGAPRGRLLRQLMTENLLLSCGAGLLGLWVAYLLPPVLLRYLSNQPLTLQIRPDLQEFGYMFALAIVACLLFGLVPSLLATKLEANDVLREHHPASGVRLHVRNVLLAIQVAACMVLLIGATLLVRGLEQAQNLDLGFSVHDVTAVSFVFPLNTYEGPRLQSFFATLQQNLAQTPLAGSVAMASREPLNSARNMVGCRSSQTAATMLIRLSVSPNYFDVLRMPVIAGRPFARNEPVTSLIVNQAAAQYYWAGQNPVGQTLTCDGQVREIVGVARDAYILGPAELRPIVYDIFVGKPPGRLLLRTTTSQDALTAVAAIVKGQDDRVKLRATPLSSALDQSLQGTKNLTTLAGILGAYALLLATVGIFGVFASVVQHRASELGIRIALGATPVQLVQGVMASTVRVVAFGILAGMVGAALASTILTQYLYGLSPLDPIAYGTAILAIAGAALLAGYLPARRATRLDPIATLRIQ